MSRYLRIRRGNRLEPHIFHSRYHVLRQLARVMGELARDPRVTGNTIVDFGCGDSPYAPLFQGRYAHYVRADLPGNPNAEIELDENGGLALPDGAANAVLSSQVLEHVNDPRHYLKEAHRLLSRDGLLIVSTHGFWRYHPDPVDYWRWTRDGLRVEVERAGFEVLQIHGVLGRAATVLQLLQDAAADAMPRAVRRLPGLVMQPAIGALEWLRRDPAPTDAAVYVVLAKRIDQPASES
jgi:SAM-dependent methyltransferase